MAVRTVYKTKDFNHRVILCSASDVAFENKEMQIKKSARYETWAKVEPKRPSFLSSSGVPAVTENRDLQTHCITINYRQDLLITSTAWIYDKRLKSAPRWFKVLDVTNVFEEGKYWEFSCRLIQMGDDMVQPANESSSFIVVPISQEARF